MSLRNQAIDFLRAVESANADTCSPWDFAQVVRSSSESPALLALAERVFEDRHFAFRRAIDLAARVIEENPPRDGGVRAATSEVA